LPAIFKKADKLPYRRHVLLLGAPRSGTTLLATMIGRHTDVGMLNEDPGRGIGKVLGKAVTGNKLCVPNQIRLRSHGSLQLRWLKRVGLATEAPASVYSIEDYLELPNLKVLAIIRDGNDTVASIMTRGKNRLRKAARRWSEAIETIYTLRQRFGPRVLVVAFDDLVLQPDTVLHRICSFLEIEFQDRMMDGHRYNLFYPQAELDREKTRERTGKNIDLNLGRIAPRALAMYRELLAQAREATGTRQQHASMQSEPA
jgi:Sulfotransferase family